MPRSRQELTANVAASWKEALTYGSLTDGPQIAADTLFEDVFETMPEHLVRQRDQLRALKKNAQER